jgi:hypothetical protein
VSLVPPSGSATAEDTVSVSVSRGVITATDGSYPYGVAPRKAEPFTGWRCLRCGVLTEAWREPKDCCPEMFAIRVRVVL